MSLLNRVLIVIIGMTLPATAQLTLKNGTDIDMNGSAGSKIIFPDGSSQSTAAGIAPADHGGTDNSVGGTGSFIGGGVLNIIYDDYSTVGGGYANTTGTPIEGDERFATVSGGFVNSASGTYTTVSGGYVNIASGESSTVSGGRENTASVFYSTVSGGRNNIANGNYATVSGHTNTASGWAATIPGGYENSASGNSSFAVGRSATATHDYSFVWGDSNGGGSSGSNTFNIHASGGIYLNGSVKHSSDRNLKEGFTAINAQDVLNKVVDMPITTWKFKSEDDNVSHIGPVAQDFMAAFGYGGDDDTHITATDADGVALAAIQGLNEKLTQELDAKQAEIDRLNAKFSSLEERLLVMEASMD